MPRKRKSTVTGESARKKLKEVAQIRRSDSNNRSIEQARNTNQHRARRSDPNNRSLEQARNTEQHRSRRSDSENRSLEQARNTVQHRVRRSDPNNRSLEQARNTEQHRSRRSVPEYRSTESTRHATRQLYNRNHRKWEEVVATYEQNILDGPTHVCFSCDRLFFKKSMKMTTKEILLETGCSEDFVNNIVLSEFIDKSEYHFCSTCMSCLNGRIKKYPKFNINMSKLEFPEEIEAVKKLTTLEERLVSPRIPFMKIFALGCDRQYGIKGGVVNVPVDVPKMFESIPIRPEQTGIIHLKMKRQLHANNYYQWELVRPTEVYEAAEHLMPSPLYKYYDIKLDQNWTNLNITVFNADPSEEPMDITEQEEQNCSEAANDENEGDAQNTYEETLFDSTDVIEFAPGEGQTPISILTDKHCEELAWPTIWYGHERCSFEDCKLSYEDHVYSELRRRDRRCVRVDHLLFVNRKCQLIQYCSKVNIVMKMLAQNNNITASQALDKDYIDDAVGKDNAYRFTASITGSPGYWEHQKKNVLAMVRQFGIFTFFVTLSAAESQWLELLQMLKKTVDAEENADVSSLSSSEKCRLIRSDPVTCALYFEHRFKELMKTWYKTEEGPFANYKIQHKYYRIEFQHRGSPHVHMILWVKDAPVFNPNNDSNFDEISAFIDQLMTTSSDDPEIADFIKYQRHKCTHTCKKTARGKVSCRFGAPFPPMDRTRILMPIPDDIDISQEEQKENRELIKKMRELLEEQDCSMKTFDDFLRAMNITLDRYIFLMRSQLKCNKIFIKRLPKDSRVNQYNKKILMLMRSNMDIQFVLDAYACVQYIVDYINKSQRGLSKLVRDCVEDFKRGNYSLRDKLKAVAYTMYNGSEVSAQEAAWCRLRLPMSSCSTVVEFINTGPINTRHRVLKSAAELEKLRQIDPNTVDIYKKGTIERYSTRPAELNSLCLAKFFAYFTFKGRGNRENDGNEEQENENDELQADENENNEISQFKKEYIIEDGILHRRSKPKVIRFCRFDLHKDPENFYRERVMLFCPWRDEMNEVELANCEEIFIEKRELIEQNSKKFIAIDLDLNEVYDQLERQRSNEEDDEERPQQSQDEEDELINVLDYDDNIIRPDVTIDLGEQSCSIIETKKYSIPDQLPDEKFFELCDSLNEKQRDYLMHVLNEFKTSNQPIYHFISGGAGVGKSCLIKAIYQALIRFFRSTPGPVESPEILIVSYTGKAAHNVGGMTAHAAFSLAIARNGETMKNLSHETLNTIRVKLAKLKLVIIDEISMMGTRTFTQIHRRLSQITGLTKPFGGCSIIAVGDFNQLKPVKEGYVFSPDGRGCNRIVGNPLWNNFVLFELDEIMRQRDDLRFAESLQRLATGSLTNEDILLFKSRCFKSEDNLPPEGKNAVRLIRTNNDIAIYNERKMLQLAPSSPMIIAFAAKDRVINAISETDKRQALHNLADLPAQKTQGLPQILKLQVGIRYLVTSNIDVEDGLYNGATGILRMIEIINGKPHAIYLEFDNECVGKIARSNRRAIMEANPTIKSNWTPIQRVKGQFTVTRRHIRVMREQYPMVVAEAITIHKSQGMSMKTVAVKLDSYITRPLLYVACSRAVSLNGLYLIGEFKAPKAMENDYPPKVEMERLRRRAVLKPKFLTLKENNNNVLKIVSHNVQSIRKHKGTINADKVFTSSDILLLQESWALSHESFPIVGMIEVQRNKFSNRPSAKGTIIYCKPNLNVSSEFSAYEDAFGDQHIEMTFCTIGNLYLINIYVNPKSSFEYLQRVLNIKREVFDNENVLLCGDFNANFLKDSNVERFLEMKFGLRLLSPRQFTTDSKTMIDAVFGKLDEYEIAVSIYESYASFHKPLVIAIMEKSRDNLESTLSLPMSNLNNL